MQFGRLITLQHPPNWYKHIFISLFIACIIFGYTYSQFHAFDINYFLIMYTFVGEWFSYFNTVSVFVFNHYNN